MCVNQDSRKNISNKLRVELVDNWHSRWPDVLSSIDSIGHRQSLLVDEDGWLSARQVLLVCFHEESVAGHLCFRISPVASERGQVAVEAHLDAMGVRPGFESVTILSSLKSAAKNRARDLRCQRLVGFDD